MAIDTSGKWWKGSRSGDVEPYLRAYTEDGYPVGPYRLCKCACGSDRFYLEVQDQDCAARRQCEACGAQHFIADSAEHWVAKGRTKKFKCICQSKVANIGVGFSLYADGTAIRWLYIGERCAECGVLGSMADWKVGYEPSLQLLDLV